MFQHIFTFFEVFFLKAALFLKLTKKNETVDIFLPTAIILNGTINMHRSHGLSSYLTTTVTTPVTSPQNSPFKYACVE